MTTPGLGNYGLGDPVAKPDGVTVIMHNGGIEGYNKFLPYVPDRKFTIVVLSNVNGNAPDQMGDQLIEASPWEKRSRSLASASLFPLRRRSSKNSPASTTSQRLSPSRLR